MRRYLAYIIILLLSVIPLTAKATGSESSAFGQWYGVDNSESGFTDPFDGWYGVRNVDSLNSTDPFTGWYGVRNVDSLNSTDPFTGWYGVRNVDNLNTSDPFTGWYGIRNVDNLNTSDPFDGWYGVRNVDSLNTSDPFTGWYGVRNLDNGDANDPFGPWSGVRNIDNLSAETAFDDWYGTRNLSGSNISDPNNAAVNMAKPQGYNAQPMANNPSNYDALGYPVRYKQAGDTSVPTANTSQRSDKFFVAPLTGIETAAPFGFAGLITGIAAAFLNRRRLYRLIFA
jgi:hypothetical protein